MKVEVLAPDKGHGERDFHFNAHVKRVHIYQDGYPQFSEVWYSIVEEPIGTIKVIRHGKTVDDVHTILKLHDDGEEVRL
jgi:hypothetical protein